MVPHCPKKIQCPSIKSLLCFGQPTLLSMPNGSFPLLMLQTTGQPSTDHFGLSDHLCFHYCEMGERYSPSCWVYDSLGAGGLVCASEPAEETRSGGSGKSPEPNKHCDIAQLEVFKRNVQQSLNRMLRKTSHCNFVVFLK